MALKVVFFDVGETLVDETRTWERAADLAGVPQFFRRLGAETGFQPAEIASVGDRVDDDVAPALAAGFVAFHLRRGPWGCLHEPPAGARRLGSLAELPAALADV
jgi:FMN phosphatase YigB (HAD superfamily)